MWVEEVGQEWGGGGLLTGPQAPAGVEGALRSCVRKKDQFDQLGGLSSAFPGTACNLMHPLILGTTHSFIHSTEHQS